MHSSHPLGQLLVTSGLLSEQALEEVLALQKTDPRRFGELLADRGLVRPHQLAQFLSHQLACPWVSLQRVEVSREAVNVLPKELALKHHMVPVHLRTSKGATALYVAMDDPTDEVALAEATDAVTMPVKPMVALASEVRATLELLYGDRDSQRTVVPGSAPEASQPPASPFPPQVKPRSLPAAPLIYADVIPDSRPGVGTTRPPRVFEKGNLIDGRYELLRELGGKVPRSRWEALHVRTARRVVLKIGVRDDSGEETDADAVRREHLALRRLHHPSAIDLRDAGATETGEPFVVLEMLEGRTLEGLVAARGALLPTEACALVRQIGDVLVAAHKAGVLHHEVHPENVLVVRDVRGAERVKLVDWESATTVEGDPEAAVDLAGLGACTFYALAGRSRLDGEDISLLNLPSALKGVIARAIGGASA
jgi:hypothetical protein